MTSLYMILLIFINCFSQKSQDSCYFSIPNVTFGQQAKSRNIGVKLDSWQQVLWGRILHEKMKFSIFFAQNTYCVSKNSPFPLHFVKLSILSFLLKIQLFIFDVSPLKHILGFGIFFLKKPKLPPKKYFFDKIQQQNLMY